MATQLLRLRNVPEDELLEIYELLDEHEIQYYETSAGSWGISMPALWLSRDEQKELAQGILAQYAEQRAKRVRAEYAALKESGQARTVFDIVREKPLLFVFYTIAVMVLLAITLLPFISLVTDY